MASFPQRVQRVKFVNVYAIMAAVLLASVAFVLRFFIYVVKTEDKSIWLVALQIMKAHTNKATTV